MAIVTAFIRVSTTKKKEANVRFRLRDGRASVIIFKRTESKIGTLESEERGDFDYFLSIRKLSDVRTRNFRVLYRALQRFEHYRRLNVYKKYTLKYDSMTPDILREFEAFLRQEHTFFKIDEETGKPVCLRQHKPIYDAFPETRIPKQRGQNTINDLFTKLRTFFCWAVESGKTQNNPFTHFAVQECVYGTPYYITIEERNKIYHTNLDHNPALAV